MTLLTQLSMALVQITLIALLGLVAWLAVLRGGPALRGAVILATLVGLLAVPALAALAPVWLPLPQLAYLAEPAAEDVPTASAASVAATNPSPVVNASEGSAKAALEVAGMIDPPNELLGDLEASEFDVAEAFPVDIPAAAVPMKTIARPTQSPISALATVWMLGALGCLALSLVRLGRLYGWARRARPIVDDDLETRLRQLAARFGVADVSLCESPAVASPLTLGLFRPVILQPTAWRLWPTEQQTLILAHELAHVRRRDFLAGLVAELAACLLWFHPLVRWLVGRLRLEQEYTADAWAVSAANDRANYVRCLARLALELGGSPGFPAPALWRRRPEILRRIDMLRHHPHEHSPRLGRRTAWTVATLATAVCVTVAGVGPLRSVAAPLPFDEKPAEVKSSPKADLHGDPLPEGAVARLGTTRWRHGADITFVAFGADGKTVVTAGQDHTVRVWDLATGQELWRVTPPRSAPIGPTVMPPRKVLEVKPKPADESAKKKAELDKALAAEVAAVAKLQALRPVAQAGLVVALTPDGNIVAAGDGRDVHLYEWKKDSKLRTLSGPATGLVGLLCSPDGKILAGRGGDGTVILWEIPTGKELHQLKGPAPALDRRQVAIAARGGLEPPGMAFSPDGDELAVATTEFKDQRPESSVKIWDVETGKETRQIKAPDGPGVSGVAFSPDGTILAYAVTNIVHLCEADTGKELRQLTARQGAASLVFAPDGKSLATRGRAGDVRVWDTASGKERYHVGEPTAVGGNRPTVVLTAPAAAAPETRVIAFSRDGHRLATAFGGAVRLWDAASGKELLLGEGHRKAVTQANVSADGKTVVTWGADQTLRRWDAGSGKPLRTYKPPYGTRFACIAPDGRVAALAHADNTILIVETATGKELQKIAAHHTGTGALAFSPDGKILAARNGENGITLYDVVKGGELRALTAQTPANPGTGVVVVSTAGTVLGNARAGLAFSPDGKWLASSGPSAFLPGPRTPRSTLDLYDVGTGKAVRKLESPQAAVSFAFAPDGRVLVTENADQSLSVWEVASGKERARLGRAASPAPVGGAMTFAVAAKRGLTVPEPGGPTTLAFAPDGRTLVARGTDRSIHVWDVAAGKEISQAAGQEGRIETLAFAADGKTVVSGGSDTTVLVWEAARLLKDLPKPQRAELPADAVEVLWNDLASEDAGKAAEAVLKLAAAPAQSVPFLAERLQPAAPVDAAQLEHWLGEVDSEKYAVRREAAASLVKAGDQAVPALQKVLAAQPTIETRKRLEEVLDKLIGGTLSSEQLRLIRAVEALERMDVPEARKVLQSLAQGARGALATREAQAALERSSR